MATDAAPIVQLENTTFGYGKRLLWHNMSLTIQPGEFIAVLGPNGSGKSSLLKVLLGQLKLQSGRAEVRGLVGYIPQERAFDTRLPLRGRDLVRLGVDGERWGLATSPDAEQKVDAALKAVGAVSYQAAPIGSLSGGEQQRLRVAQAIANSPELLLCDEPLLSLDVTSQQKVGKLIDAQRGKGAAVVFVTHEINPILPCVDRLLYVVNGKWRLGKPQDVLTSKSLTELYGMPVEVLRVHGRIIVVAGDLPTELSHSHHHQDGAEHD